MSTQIAIEDGKQLARPLKVLVPLIREDLERANEASERAAKPYFQAAGEKMIEAKAQMKHGEFMPWVRRNFRVGDRAARLYMTIARAAGSTENGNALPFSSLREAVRQTSNNPNFGRQSSWHGPVREALGRVDLGALNRRRDETDHLLKENQVRRELALQLIDIGYKALAAKLHPDKGGSKDAMARLNFVRNQLKSHV